MKSIEAKRIRESRRIFVVVVVVVIQLRAIPRFLSSRSLKIVI